MEIQDKGNILQQFLNAKMSNSFMVQTSEGGFAEMLKSDKAENAEAEVFSFAANKGNVEIKGKEEIAKSDFAFKDAKKENVKSKKTADTQEKTPDKSKDKKVTDNSGDDSVAAAQAPVEEVAEDVVSKDGSVEIEENIAENIEENITGGSVENIAVADVVSAVIASPDVETVVEPHIDIDVAVLNEVNQPVVVEAEQVEIDEGKVKSAVTPSEVVEEPVSLIEDDALLLRQAEYIDKKVNSQVKMKIEVDVQAEKIAAPLGDKVLQNGFEVDSLVREFENGETVVKPETKAASSEMVDTPLNNQPLAGSSIKVSGNNSQLAMAVVQTTDETTAVSIEASKISASGKEMVVEASSNMRAETFSRINDTSSRDVFKGLGKEAVEQIKVNITKSAVKGVDTIDIQLKPEDLGKIQIKMHISKDGKVQAEIISGRQETLDMLQKEISGLSKAFEDAGYETDGQSFSFSFQEDNQAGKQSGEDAELLKFIGDTLEQEADNAAGNDNIVYNPALGLNIRV